MKPVMIKRPRSWAKLDKVGKFPVPFIASRYDGRIELATKCPFATKRVVDEDLCHLCGAPLHEPPSVLVSAPQLSVGLAIEPRGHFACIGHATSVCPHLVRGGPQIIATCEHVTGVLRPIASGKAYYVEVMGAVTHLAIVSNGLMVWQLRLDEDEDDDRTADYADLAREAMLAAQLALRRAA